MKRKLRRETGLAESEPVGVRIQRLARKDQVVVLARLAEARAVDGLFMPSEISKYFDDFALPPPAKVSNYLATLSKNGLLTRTQSGKWRLTPFGLQHAEKLASDVDLAALSVEASRQPMTLLAGTIHPIIPPSLAPPELIPSLRRFLDKYPFERNIFGMTRFPGKAPPRTLDPIAPALEVTRELCRNHGLNFHLASDRQIVDELWPNVAAHIWGCKFGIAFYEDRTGRGLNYNLNIEVGSCLVLGRRIAILKDVGVRNLPTDLVGKIYKSVDLENIKDLKKVLQSWIRKDLNLT